MKYKEILAKISEKAKAQQALIDKAKAEKREELNEDEIKQFEDLQKEIENLRKQAEIAQKMEENERYLNEPANKSVLPATTETQEEQLDDGGFKNVGEFLNCVKNGDASGRLKALSTSDAGILIPPQFAKNIMSLSGEDEIVRPRATNIPAGSPPDAPFTVPYLQQGADGFLGGIELTWTNEAKTVSDTKDPVIKDLTLTPNEVSGMATINNKTLNNWEASGAFVEGLLRQAFTNGHDIKCLGGSGAGCPLGIRFAPGAIKIARNTTGTFVYADAANMLGRLLPEALPNAVWLISITQLPNVVQMVDGNGRLIFVQGDATKGVPATLIGIPIIWTGKTPTKGNEGDVMLVDFKYYLCKEGSGPYVSISEHVKFTTNQTVFKIVSNIDGQPWVKDPLKLTDGKTTVSPYIILK